MSSGFFISMKTSLRRCDDKDTRLVRTADLTEQLYRRRADDAPARVPLQEDNRAQVLAPPGLVERDRRLGCEGRRRRADVTDLRERADDADVHELSSGVLAARNVGRKVALGDRKSTRLNSSHIPLSRMPSSA